MFRLFYYFKNLRQSRYLRWIARQFRAFGEGSTVTRLENLSHPERISIGKHVTLGRHGVLEVMLSFRGQEFPEAEIIIGDHSNIGDYFHIGAVNKLDIGKNVLMGRYVLIIDHGHGGAEDLMSDVPPFERQLRCKGSLTIGDNVWIGDKVSIVSGVTVGEGAIIGANSVVTHDVPSHSFVAGIPAKVIR